ncbi:hypothetical protein GGX14DRAFT_396391 [Mycena pura]|uniref:Uncharacterized protein n=1 Tax=Mycena pura TaxID=153505 RepID=A0AAD6Y9V7_9AGAR|nr:hypothetical protein GGX14DRAFT_396391 [Mycena pura]
MSAAAASVIQLAPISAAFVYARTTTLGYWSSIAKRHNTLPSYGFIYSMSLRANDFRVEGEGVGPHRVPPEPEFGPISKTDQILWTQVSTCAALLSRPRETPFSDEDAAAVHEPSRDDVSFRFRGDEVDHFICNVKIRQVAAVVPEVPKFYAFTSWTTYCLLP